MFKGLGVIIALLSSSASAQDYSHCTAGLNATAKQVNVTSSSDEYTSAIFSQECEQSGTWKAKSGGIGLETVIKALPIKFSASGSNNEQVMRNFCSTFAKEQQGTAQSYSYREKVMDRALDTFDQCIRFTAQGVTVHPKLLNLDAFAIDLVPGVGKPIEIQGVNLSANINCISLHPITKKTIKMEPSTNLEVRDSTFSLACTRSSILGPDKSRTYEEATVLMPIKPYGTYSLLIPKDVRLPVDQATLVAGELERLKGDLATLNAQLTARILELAQDTEGLGQIRDGSTITINGPRIDGSDAAECPPSTYVSKVHASGSVGGKYGVDGISEIRVTCSALRTPKKLAGTQ